MANSPVKLSVVHPGGVATNIVRNSRTGAASPTMRAARESIDRFDAIAKTTPPAAAQRIITGIEKNQPRILIGNDARFMDLLQRFRPATYWAVLAKRIEKAAGRRGSEVHVAARTSSDVVPANAGTHTPRRFVAYRRYLTPAPSRECRERLGPGSRPGRH